MTTTPEDARELDELLAKEDLPHSRVQLYSFKQKLLQWRVHAVSQTAKAYGSCAKCYGKGYATVNDRWIGTDTDTDIGSTGWYIHGGNPNAMKFCSCDRGKQVKRHFDCAIKEAYQKARIDEAKVCDKARRHQVNRAVEEARIDELKRVYIAYGTNHNAKFFHVPDGKAPLQPLQERLAQLTRTNTKGEVADE